MFSTSPVLAFAVRSAQALFAFVVFGLSISLIKGHRLGSLPSTLSFVAFVGGVSIIGALLGIAAHWMQVLRGQIGVAIDVVIAGINIAGGTLMAVKLKGVHCKSIEYKGHHRDDSGDADHLKLLTNDIICGGFMWLEKERYGNTFHCAYLQDDTKMLSTLLSRCNMSQADSVFMFLTAIVVAVAAVLGYLRMKRGD